MTVWTSVSYLPNTPISVITLSFLLLCFFGAKAGIRQIAICAGILLPIVMVLGLFVGITNLQFKHYSLLLPILTHGYGPTLHATLISCGGLFEIMLILYIRHYVSTAIRLPGLLFVLLIVGGLTIGVLTGAISLFGPFAAADFRYPAFEQWRLVAIGKYISHLDFLSIYQWLSGAFIRVSLMLFLIPDVLRARTERERTVILLLFSVLLFGLSLLPISDLKYFNQLKSWYFLVSLGASLLLTLLPLGLSWLPDKRKETRTHVKKT
jgi:spore germination protein (amino acid permease)